MDPCWLPSAIMQTMGAMLSIYVGIYVLAVQRLFNRKAEIQTEQQADEQSGKVEYFTDMAEEIVNPKIGLVNKSFLILVILCGSTIIANSLWLDSLSTQLLITHSIPWLGYMAFSLFVCAVILICANSLWIIVWLKEGKEMPFMPSWLK